MKKIKETLREWDWFGHTIALNFNREGETHNTAIGGCCSINLRIAVLIYFIVNLNKLLFKEEDDINYAMRTDTKIEDVEHTVGYNAISLAMFWIMRTSNGVENALWLTDELKPFLTAEFVQ